MLLAQYQNDLEDTAILEAIGLLDRLLQATEQGRRARSVIEILVIQALAYQIHDNTPSALVPLERALMLAEPEGYFRIFVDEGSPMATLLEKATQYKIAPHYVRHLLTAFGKAEDKPLVKQGLLEPLSERELEVLQLLRTDLDGPEIAHELIVSLNTLRTHTKNIYTKLGVNSRRSAVLRAEELNLL